MSPRPRNCWKKAGLKDGFSVTMDVRNTQPVTGIAESIQQTVGQAGVKLEIIPGDGKQTLTKYRARTHDIYIGQWGMDYFDPNSMPRPSPPTPTIRRRHGEDAGLAQCLGRAGADQGDQGGPAGARQRQARHHVQGTAEGGTRHQPVRLIFQQTEVAGLRGNVKGTQARAELRYQLRRTRTKD
jgi:peptide/nickel transport system substrate-binding protein